MKKTIEYGKSGILVLSVIIIFLVIFLAFESLTLISPIGTVTERSPVFEWRGDYDNYRILVDDDKLFETPILDTEFSEEYFEYEGEFDFGEYYWKLIVIDGDRIIESKPIKFDVIPLVAYSIDEQELINEGNADSKLSSITGEVVLEPGESMNLEEEDYLLEQE